MTEQNAVQLVEPITMTALVATYSKPDGSSHVSFKTVVYQKGIDYIRRKLECEAKKAA